MTSLEWTEPELDAAYARAGRRAARSEPRAITARYEPAARRLVIELSNGATFMVPVDLLEGLAQATPEALDAIEVTPGGEGLRFPALDADLSVPGLLAGVFGSRRWMGQLRQRGSAGTPQEQRRRASRSRP